MNESVRFQKKQSKRTNATWFECTSIFKKLTSKCICVFLASDIEPYTNKPSPVIDENARADAHDIDNLHQVIDLNPTQILPATDENAVDSMDFENQMR